MSRALETLALCGLVTAGCALAADDPALRQCRALADATARLACYDALPLAAAPAASTRVPVATTASMPAPVATPAPAQGAATFGMEQRQPELAAITTRIEGRFEGWQPGSRIRLANGQVWQVSDGSTGVYELTNPTVTLRRGALSGFWLEIEGVNRSPRVRRVE
jgi:hypothetical protein